MHVDVVSVFPEYFTGPFGCGPTRVAQEKGVLSLSVTNPRDFTVDPHRTVDDYPFGGGPGMVMKPEPIAAALEQVRRPGSHVILLSPRGRLFDQACALDYSRRERLVLVCGRYKGVDERVAALADEELSLGDFVLAGGEPAACCVVDALARLLPGAVEDKDSVNTDSFSEDILDAPYYTRPRCFRGRSVPEPLLSGNHVAISRWRREAALLATALRRPELLRRTVLTRTEREFLRKELEKEITHGKETETD